MTANNAILNLTQGLQGRTWTDVELIVNTTHNHCKNNLNFKKNSFGKPYM